MSDSDTWMDRLDWRKRGGLTRRGHVGLGEDLQDAREMLVARVVQLGRLYPKGSRAARLAVKALVAVDALRSEMDSVSSKELPAEDWSPLIYYGADTEARDAWLEAHPLPLPKDTEAIAITLADGTTEVVRGALRDDETDGVLSLYGPGEGGEEKLLGTWLTSSIKGFDLL